MRPSAIKARSTAIQRTPLLAISAQRSPLRSPLVERNARALPTMASSSLALTTFAAPPFSSCRIGVSPSCSKRAKIFSRERHDSLGYFVLARVFCGETKKESPQRTKRRTNPRPWTAHPHARHRFPVSGEDWHSAVANSLPSCIRLYESGNQDNGAALPPRNRPPCVPLP